MSKRSPLRYWLRLILFGLIAFYVLANVGLAYWAASNSIVSAKGSVCCDTPAIFGATFENIQLTTSDNLALKGWYIPSQNRAAIILLHGYGGNRLSLLPFAEFLYRQGYGVLLYDQRASGESEGDLLSWGWRDVYDVESAVSYLQGRSDIDPTRLGVFGCSTGAEIALASAARLPAIGAVVADAPYYTVAEDMPPPYELEDWLAMPMYPMFIQFMEWKSGASAPAPLSEAVTQIAPRPLLLISAGSDFEQRQVQRYYDLAREPKIHWNIPEAAHCGGHIVRPKEYETSLLNTFQYLLP